MNVGRLKSSTGLAAAIGAPTAPRAGPTPPRRDLPVGDWVEQARRPAGLRTTAHPSDDDPDDPWGLDELFKPRPLTDEEKASLWREDAVFNALAARLGRTRGTATIAVLDSGVEIGHPYLRAHTWTNDREIAGNGRDDDGNGKVDDIHGWDFVRGSPRVDDDTGHGTHVAGIATRGSERLKAMPLKVYNPLTAKAVREAIDYAAAQGVRVVNMSFVAAGKELVAGITAAIAAHPEMLFVKSAGNSRMKLGGFFCSVNADNYLSAASLPNMLVVANADQKGKRYADSNYGERLVHLAAPGTGVPSCAPHGDVVLKTGTSMAAPLVAAIAAKCLLLNPRLRVAQLRGLLADTCDTSRAWAGKVASGGVVNGERAMRLAALMALVADGSDPADAATRLGLAGDERARLIALVERR